MEQGLEGFSCRILLEETPPVGRQVFPRLLLGRTLTADVVLLRKSLLQVVAQAAQGARTSMTGYKLINASSQDKEVGCVQNY